MDLVFVLGARPQFIKLAPLYHKLKKVFNLSIIHTGQHFDKEMSDIFFSQLTLPKPDYNLCINSGSHATMTGKMLIGIERVLLSKKPDFVIIFGDTNSTLAGALVASKLNISLIHIEAGLRSFNRMMPEEINRILSDKISNYLFAPTKVSYENLKNEGLLKNSFLTGDIMVDSVEYALKNFKYVNSGIRNLSSRNKYYYLTLHRSYNVDDPVTIKKLIYEIGKLNISVIFPVHPRTRNNFSKFKIILPDNIIQINPVSFIDSVYLQYNSDKVITDSGGIQKEAYILKKPCVTLRSETEWTETVSSGNNLLINPVSGNIHKRIMGFNPKIKHYNFYGKNVSEKMKNIITKIIE